MIFLTEQECGLDILHDAELEIISNGRNNKHAENYALFLRAFIQNPEYALRWLLYLRDIKYGLGQREAYKGLLFIMSHRHTELMIKFLQLDLSKFGRYDDELSIYAELNSACQGVVIEKIKRQLAEDLALCKEGKEISLLAKWMPSINTSSRHTRNLANLIRTDLQMSPRQYRKTLSKLRKHLQILETKISNKDYDSIDYNNVPAIASIVYRKAFMRHDKVRRTKFLKYKKSLTNYQAILNKYNNKKKLPFMNIISSERYDIVKTIFNNSNNEFVDY